MPDILSTLTIERLSERGEGIARTDAGRIFVPYALAGEIVEAEVEGSRACLKRTLATSPDRIAPFCSYFARCGGCAVQTLAPEAYLRWKRDLVVEALRRAGLAPEVSELTDAHGEGRRRAVFHVRYPGGRPAAGFMQTRSHEVVEISHCPLLAPAMVGALSAARAIANTLRSSARPLDIIVTLTQTGLDVDIRGHGPTGSVHTQALVEAALAHHLARLSNHGRVLISPRNPAVAIGKAWVEIPPGVFLQPTLAGEEALGSRVCTQAAGATRAADLFCGIGTFALRLAGFAKVDAFDCDGSALAALRKAAAGAALREVRTLQRDLFRQPLAPHELEAYDAVVFDPPRSGAEAQARAAAASSVPLIAAVSCNPKTFARDAAILCSGGYELVSVEPIDQFRYSPHVEIVAFFRRRPRARKKPVFG